MTLPKMSILLSAYYPEGIVYVSDKNITVEVKTTNGKKKYVEPTGTKVLSWPNNKAIIGYVGLASLASLPLEEYIRIFIASTRNFTDIEKGLREIKRVGKKQFAVSFLKKSEKAEEIKGLIKKTFSESKIKEIEEEKDRIFIIKE